MRRQVSSSGGRKDRPTQRNGDAPPLTYTCAEYRQEMLLLGLRRRLAEETLGIEERKRLREEIRTLEVRMQMETE